MQTIEMTVDVPRQFAQRPRNAVGPMIAQIPRRGRLLLAAPDAACRCDMIAALGPDDHDVVEAADAAELLLQLARVEAAGMGRLFDVIICDGDLPGLDFGPVARALSRPGLSRALILVASEGQLGTAAKAIRLGATTILWRPFALRRLRWAVQPAVGR